MSNVAELVELREQFPIFNQTCRGKPLVYLDTGATAQKPSSVIETIDEFYGKYNANVHRGVYELSEKATTLFENVRDQLKNFINAEFREEIIFTQGTTASINLLANCFGALNIKKDDEIIISAMEHHSNIVPWQMLCERVGAKLVIIPLTLQGELDLDAFSNLINSKTRLVSLIHLSNVLGTVNPIETFIKLAHAKSIPVLIDGAQAISRIPVDVKALDCDFYVFSSHKMYGPTGLGVLYGKKQWLEKMPPYQGGGDMIRQVSFTKTEYNVLPYKFEAGTPNIAAVVGLGAALKFIEKISLKKIFEHEKALTQYALKKLRSLPQLTIYGSSPTRLGVISFTLDPIHPHDMASILDNEGIAIRAGHHCAMPLMEHYQVAAMARISFGIYNTQEDIDRLMLGLSKALEIFGER